MKHLFLFFSLFISINSFSQSDCEEDFYIPNSFTANNDLRNDVWHPVTCKTWEKYELKVYNCWGECVWQTYDVKDCWMGEGLKEENYYNNNNIFHYILIASNEDKSVEKKGVVYLMR